MPEEDLRHYHNKTRPDPLDEKLHLLGSLLIWSTTKDTKLHKGLNSKGLSSCSPCASCSNHIQNKS